MNESPWAFGPSPMTGLGDQNQQMMTAENYPSFPNAAGVGSQTALQAPAPMQSQPMQSPSSTPASTSPWLFQGAALSR